jgi:aspartate racemase
MENAMQQPTIGILAGMGPASTGPFIDLVVAECRSQYGARDDIDFPKMVIVSQPAPFFHDREMDHDAVEAATIEGLQHLESAGADVIGIACNSVHVYFPRLAASISAPLLDIVAEAFDALPADARTVAIAASRPLVESGLYQDRAAQRGLRVVEPDWQPQIDAIQEMVKTETSPAAFAATWAELFGRLDDTDDVDAVVIACLDVSGVFRYADPPVLAVDAARALAARLVREWLLARNAGERASAIQASHGRFDISTDASRVAAGHTAEAIALHERANGADPLLEPPTGLHQTPSLARKPGSGSPSVQRTGDPPRR